MATIASLIVDISAKTSQLKQGLSEASASTDSFAKSCAKNFAVLGTVITTAFLGAMGTVSHLVQEQADKIDNLSKEAQKIGATYGEFQRLSYGADLAGVSSDALAGSIKKLNLNLVEASEKGGPAKDALDKLGLSAGTLLAMNVEDRYLAISDALKTIGSNAEQTAISVDLFGKSGMENLVLLNSNIRETSAEFDALGITITDSQAKVVEEFNDSKTKLATIYDGLISQITVQLVPTLLDLTNSIIESVKEWGGMEIVANDVASAFLAGLTGILEALNWVVKGWSMLQLTITGVQVVITDVTRSLTTFLYYWFKLVGDNDGAAALSGVLLSLDDQLDKLSIKAKNLKETLMGKGALDGAIKMVGEQKLKIDLAGEQLVAKRGEGGAESLYEGTFIGGVLTEFSKAQDEVSKGFSMMAQAAKDNADKVTKSGKSLEDAIAGLEKSAGQSELTRILGLDKQKEDKNPIAQSDKFDDLVRKIYQKGTSGLQEEFTGEFNGKQIKVGKSTTLEQDLEGLQGIMQSTARGGGNVIGMKGALDELTKFVNNKTQQKVKVEVSVKADKGFLVEVAQSEELAKAVDEYIKNGAANEAKKMRG